MSQRETTDSPIALIDKSELAQALGVSTYTLDDWLRKGKLPRPIPLAGNVHRWRLTAIQQWLAKLERAPYTPPTLRGRVKAQLLAQYQPEADEEPPRPKRERVRLTDRDEMVEDVSQQP